MSLSIKSTNVGSSMRIDIDIANVGKTPALLMKLDGVAPGNAFEPEPEKNQHHFLQGGTSISVDLKGKRLEYLKAHEMSIHLIAKSKGTFELKPKILFVDELGKYRSYEFEPQSVEVKELGFLGKRERRLAAIMFADIVGYTSLSQWSESLALQLLGEYRQVLRPFFPRHSGSEIKTIGDGFLVEFASALEAVRCAFEIQQSLHERNASQLLPEKSINVRIGIHLGDVIHDESDVYGDAVNVASRIEPLSEPGGICISEQVYDHVRNKFEFPLVSLGRKELKNVEIPIEVYRVALPWKMMQTGG
jgi:class 3 adenylate cyclase